MHEYDKAIEILRATLTRIQTVPMITSNIIHILREQRMGYTLPLKINNFYSDQIKEFARKVYMKQVQVGLDALSRGILIHEWETLQNICQNDNNTTGSNVEWVSRVIGALWMYSKTVWDGRSKFINTPTDTTKTSLKTKELL